MSWGWCSCNASPPASYRSSLRQQHRSVQELSLFCYGQVLLASLHQHQSGSVNANTCQQAQEGSEMSSRTGCCVHSEPHLEETFGLCIDSSKAVWHEFYHCCPDGFAAKFHIIQELLGHTATPYLGVTGLSAFASSQCHVVSWCC